MCELDRAAMVFLCTLTLAWCALGQELVLERTSPAKEALPGELVTHVFSLLNDTETALVVEISVDFPAGWGLLTPMGDLEIGPGQEELVFLTLAVPRTAYAGEYQITLTVNWSGGTISETGLITVMEVHEVEVIAPGDGEALPGGTALYRFSVVNRGNSVDMFIVAAVSAHGWTVEVRPRELTLAPGERGLVEVQVHVPLGTDVDRDLLQFSASSVDRPDVEASASLFTEVLPPTPDLVMGTRYAQLRSRLGTDFAGDLFTTTLTSSLSFLANGTLLDGWLNFSLRTDGPFGPTPYRLSRLSLTYHRERVRIVAGDVSLWLTPLLSVAGDGLQVELTGGGWAADLLTGWQGEEGRAGAKVLARNDDWEWGLAYREARGPAHAAAADVWTVVPLVEGLTALFEIGLGYQSPFTDRALLVRLEADATPPLRLRLDAFSVGPYFPGRRRDQEGIAFSGTLRAEPATLRFSVEHRWDNVWQIPGESSVVRTSLNIHCQFAPDEWPMGFSGGVMADRTREEIPSPTTDSRTRRLEVGLTGGESPFSFVLTGRWQENVDFVSATGYHSLEYQQRFYLATDRFTATVRLVQDANYGLDWSFLDSDWSASLTLRNTGSPHPLSFTWTHSEEGGRADFRLEYELASAFVIKAGVSSRWDAAGVLISLRLQAGFAYEFSWNVPFLPAKGWLEGEVFLDQDRDGERDPGEPGVQATVLSIERIRVSTDERGRFRFPPLPPGEYEVTVERLPLGIRPLVPGPYRVEVAIHRREELTIPCQMLASIQGLVYDDQDQDGTRAPTEPGLPGVRISLLQAGEEVTVATSGPDGAFSFPDLPPGEYTLRLERTSLPERYEPTTPEELSLTLTPGERAQVEFGAWQRPRPVVVTFQPPFADFLWEPEQPVAGAPVRFDGTLSVDFDGEIVEYAWDFDGDGEVDSTQPVAEWTFPEPGTYPVSLTVVDNDGNQDTVVLEVDVGPGE